MKEAQNPKDEVSSSKTEEMVKDWKNVAKSQNERFSKIERFALCKRYYQPSTKWLSFRPGCSILAKTGLCGFVIMNGKKSRRANAPNSSEFEESRNFQTMGRLSATADSVN